MFNSLIGRAEGKARAAVTTVFVIHGLLFASWTAHIPEVKAHLRLTNGDLGLSLLGAPLGSVIAMIFAGALLTRVGSRAVVRVTVVGYCLSGLLVGQAGSQPQLFAALAVWGAFLGVLDVAMNAQGVAVERTRRRPIMSTLHGSWSIGALSGACVGALGVGVGISLTTQVLLLGPPCLLAGVVATRHFVADRATGGSREPSKRHRGRVRSLPRIPRVLVMLGVIAMAGLLCEGAVADWSAVYLRNTLKVSPGLSGLGYAACAAAMVVVRLAGSRLQMRTGPRRLVGGLAAVATVGISAGLLAGQPVIMIIGFGLLGVGLASVVPVVYSAAGNQPGVVPGTAVATVSAIGWVGFMCGPVVIGFLAQHTDQTVALGLIPLLTLLITVACLRSPALDRAHASEKAEAEAAIVGVVREHIKRRT